MKYTIHGFSQLSAIELKLTNDDLLFLRWFIDFKECGEMDKKYLGEEINDMGYWVSYKKIIDDLPIIFNSDSLDSNKKKIQRMLNGDLSKILYKDIQRTKEQKGTKIFLAINPVNYRLLVNATGQKCPENDIPLDKNVQYPLDKNVQSDISINNIYKKEKESNKTSLDKLIDSYTDNKELKETLKDFLKMRKTIKKPVTDRALKTILNKLNNFAGDDIDKKIYILEQSIEKSWQTVYEPKDYYPQKNKATTKAATEKINVDDIISKLRSEEI